MWKRLNAKSIMKLAMNVQTIICDFVSYARVVWHLRRRRSLPSKKALIFRVFQALLPLRHAVLPRPLMISTRNF